MQYTVNIIGTTWGGFQSAYSYNFTQTSEPTAQEIKRKAGDFSSVDDYQIITHSTEYTRPDELTIVTTHTEKIVRNWQSEESADLYLEATCND